jgi:hypothetical protein
VVTEGVRPLLEYLCCRTISVSMLNSKASSVCFLGFFLCKHRACQRGVIKGHILLENCYFAGLLHLGPWNQLGSLLVNW